MAPPATKRRKLSHSSHESSDDDDESFASFSSEDHPNGGTLSPDVSPDSGDKDIELDEDESNNGSDGSGSEMDEEYHDSNALELDKEEQMLEKRKAPTKRAEHRQIRDTSGTTYTGEVFRSNFFKLQVDELLGQVRPRKNHKSTAIKNALETLKTIIEGLPARKPTSVGEAERILLKNDKVVIPIRLPQNVNYRLEYAKPVSLNVVGSSPLNTTTKIGDDLILDFMVKMPAELFEEKDYLNHRYFHKRAFYLACLAAGIQSSKANKYKLSFDHLHGNHLLPILMVEINSSAHSKHDLPCKNLRVIILPIPETQFSKEKLLPGKNCVRSKAAGETGANQVLVPTPFYNASMRVDSLVVAYSKLQHEVANRCEGYRDACVLGRIWLRQRGLNGRIQGGGFGNFEWAIMIALLLEGGGPKGLPAFSSGYSSYQLFKAALQYLAGKDLVKNPHSVCGASVFFPKSSSPMLFDGSRALNVLFKMTPWSYKLLQHEARATIAMLNDSAFDHFDATFILRADQPLCRYDVVIELPSTVLTESSSINFGESLPKICQDLYSVLSRGLSDRIRLICLHLPEDQCWDITSRVTTTPQDSKLVVGFMLDPANSQKLVDHGPSAEDKKAAASFRRFWGDKAELRRFKDGSILESLVWSSKDGTDSIFRQSTTHILKRHFGDQFVQAMNYKGDDVGVLLGTGASATSTTAPFQPIMAAFQKLEQDIRGLDDLPLQVRHILGADAQLSYGSIGVPFIPGRTRMSTPADVVIQFEGSARWPDDLDAIQRTKIAFLIKLAEILEVAAEDITARVGLENCDLPLLNQSFLDVVYPDGSAFRLRIHHDREATLIERKLKDKTLLNQEKTDAATALASYKQSFLRQPAHTQAMQTLCTRFPALSPTVRLVKKWFASHLLSTHFSASLIELLVARTFTNPYPWTAPSSATTGFLRSLVLISRWDWRSNPWIVDLGSGDMKTEEVSAITIRFEAWRKIDPALNRVVLFAASNVDSDGTTWTDHAQPPKVVAARLTALAKAAVDVIKEKRTGLDLTLLFASSMGDYDVLIRLDPKFAKIGQSAKIPNTIYKNLQNQSRDANDELVGFNLVNMFIGDLERVFGEALVLFHNDCGGDVVAVLWNPQTEKRSWKLKLEYSTQPVVGANNESDVNACVNKEAILNEIARLGGNLVKAVEVNRHRADLE